MKTIINDDFLLKTETAKKLYHEFAENQPIIDYHCHLDPKLIAEDHRFGGIGELMLAGDHYKWRAMRSFGIDEKYMTGDADFGDKFRAFASVMPYLVGNPLYHWTHLELKRYFGIDEILNEESADRIMAQCDELLASDGYTARGLILRSNVKTLCTTDDPLDTLEYHDKIKADGFSVQVLPAFRPDKAINIHKDTFVDYIKRSGAKNYAELKKIMSERIRFFHSKGCRLADHGLDFIPCGKGDASAIFEKAMNGAELTCDEVNAYAADLLEFFAREYKALDWCLQIHVGAQRNNNTRMYKKLGADTGFDSIADTSVAAPLAALLDKLDADDALPKTILYSLNPNDNYTLATLMGCFQAAPYRSKIQLGSGWWFNDQKDGMEAQLRAYGNLGALGCFVGMLTDSRSFISYPRHEYFRRIFCNLVGSFVEDGEYPADYDALEKIVTGVCYKNAEKYFAF